MRSCPACESRDVHRRWRSEHRHGFAGIGNIILHDVTLIICPRCGRSEPVVPDGAGLNRAVARAIIGKRQRLLPPEIRFLRKQLGLSGIDLAMHLGATPESVSRWENGRTAMGVTADRLLRLMVIVADGATYSLNALRALALDAPKSTPIHVRRLDDTWEVSIERFPE